MREIRLYGSEGGGAERLFLPLFRFCFELELFQQRVSFISIKRTRDNY
jgi:hypothetical protein